MATDQDQPYVGARAFEREDAPRFFGRTLESRDLLSLVIAHSEILLFSQSGAGKTSLLNAGLVPQLKTRQIDVLPTARVRPQHEESDAGKISNIYVYNVLTGWTEGIETEELAAMSLAGFLRRREHGHAPGGEALARVIIFDQFEELFTSQVHSERAHDRENFFEQVRDALEDDGLLRVIFAMREEFIAELEPYADILPDALSRRYRLERLRRDAAIEAVEGPLQNSEVSCEPGVPERLVDELLKGNTNDEAGKARSIPGEYIEPVQLQVVCENLYKNLPPNVTEITEEHRLKYGDVDVALEKFYRDAVEQTQRSTGVLRRRLRKWVGEKLIIEGTRNFVRQGKSETGGMPNAAVKKLEELHLIRGEDRPGRGRWYELTHDRLIEPIQKANQGARRARLRRRIIIGAVVGLVLAVLLTLAVVSLYKARAANTAAHAADVVLSAGNGFFEQGRYDDALRSFQSAAQSYPNSFGAHFALGATYARLGQTDQAIAEYRKASELDRTSPHPYLRIGDLLLQSNSIEARKAYEEALKLDDKSAGAHLGLGDVNYNLGDFKEAATCYDIARELDLNYPEPLLRLGEVNRLNGEYDNAIDRFIEAIDKVSLRNDTLARAYAGMGFIYLEQAFYDAARVQFTIAIAMDAQSVDGYRGLALSYSRLGNYLLSIAEYQNALSRVGKDGDRTLLAQLHNGLGNTFIQMRSFDRAVEAFQQARDLMEDSAILFNLGICRMGQQKPDEAQALFEKAWAGSPPTTLLGKLNHAVAGTAAGKAGSVEELEKVFKNENAPLGLLEGARDDAKLLVQFRINPAQSERLVGLLETAIKARSAPDTPLFLPRSRSPTGSRD